MMTITIMTIIIIATAITMPAIAPAFNPVGKYIIYN